MGKDTFKKKDKCCEINVVVIVRKNMDKCYTCRNFTLRGLILFGNTTMPSIPLAKASGIAFRMIFAELLICVYQDIAYAF